MTQDMQAQMEEGERLRALLMERVAAGVSLRTLLMGHAAILGQMVGVCESGGRDSLVEGLERTIRYNVILTKTEAGHA